MNDKICNNMNNEIRNKVLEDFRKEYKEYKVEKEREMAQLEREKQDKYTNCGCRDYIVRNNGQISYYAVAYDCDCPAGKVGTPFYIDEEEHPESKPVMK
jgi:hypothetical protein